jgi:hypothetical protein
MHLEKPEVDFWNKTGYDPRKIWGGFKMLDDYKIYYEIYESALKYLNDKMTASNKPRIKSINDEYKEGDLVLIKDGSEYHVGAYNGVYMQIVRANVEIPKSDVELEIDRKREEEEKKLKELEMSELTTKGDNDLLLEAQNKKRDKYFSEFKKHYGIPENLTMEQMFNEIEKSGEVFDDFIAEREGGIENEANEYLDADFDDSSEY